jgi:hypothetical protein
MLLLGLNLASFTIHNGLALLFPAWVRLGETGVSGVEAMGQTMLTLIVTTLALLILMIGPAVAAAGVYFALKSVPVAGVAIAATIGGLVLAFEAYLVMGMLGGSLDRLEPSQVG